MSRTWSMGASAMVLLAAACGGGTTPPQTPAEAPAPPTAAAPAAPGEVASAAAPKASAEAPKKPDAPGKPLATYEHQTQPVTIGRDGAIIRTENGAELRIPSDAIIEPRNILLIVDRKVRGTTGKIGEVYDLPVVLPNAQYKVGEELPSQPYESANGAPFILKIPLPGGAKSANLAIETLTQGKAKKPASSWTIVAVKTVESLEKGSRAVFELRTLPGAHVHLTTSAPTAQ